MHLKNLYIDRNDIDKLPRSMADLANMKMLRILDNPKINISEPNNKYIKDEL
jgi:Leucine-rich repeat (LRR) protein